MLRGFRIASSFSEKPLGSQTQAHLPPLMSSPQRSLKAPTSVPPWRDGTPGLLGGCKD